MVSWEVAKKWASGSPVPHHSWYTPTRRRQETLYVCAEIEEGAAFCAVFQGLIESWAHVPSAISVGPPAASPLWGTSHVTKYIYSSTVTYNEVFWFSMIGTSGKTKHHLSLPEPPIYCDRPPCWSKLATSFFRRDLPLLNKCTNRKPVSKSDLNWNGVKLSVILMGNLP